MELRTNILNQLSSNVNLKQMNNLSNQSKNNSFQIDTYIDFIEHKKVNFTENFLILFFQLLILFS